MADIHNLELDLELCKYGDYTRLSEKHLSCKNTTLRSGVDVCLYVTPAHKAGVYKNGEELFEHTIFALESEEQFAEQSLRNPKAIASNINFLPQHLQVALLISNSDDFINLEFGNHFPTKLVIADNIVVPVNLLLHPVGANDVIIRLLSHTVLPESKVTITRYESLTQIDLQIRDYISRRWVDNSTLSSYFE